MNLTRFCGRRCILKKLEIAGHIRRKGVSGLVSEYINVAARTVEIGKDKRSAIKRKVRAVAAHLLAGLCEYIEQLIVVKEVNELCGIRAHLAVHSASRRQQILGGSLRNGVAVRTQEGVVEKLNPVNAYTLCLTSFQLAGDRHYILDYLTPEFRNIVGGIAVTVHSVIAELGEIRIAQLMSNFGTQCDQLIKNTVQLIAYRIVIITESGISGAAYAFFAVLAVRSHLGGIKHLAVEFYPCGSNKLGIRRNERVLLLKQRYYIR